MSELFEAGVRKDAVLSPCGRYRYRLTRVWDDAFPLVYWVMLNPSTANASVDDPTIRRCVWFAKSWGHGGIDVRNLFAVRSTDPRTLRHEENPVGPDNDSLHLATLPKGGLVVVAWGNHGSMFGRGLRVLDLLQVTCDLPLYCLGWTNQGQPKHPLYVPASTKPVSLFSKEAQT